MTYVDNIFFCMASPVLVGMLLIDRRRRINFIFVLAGMAACLFSAYVNSFLMEIYAADAATATAEITPVVEEILKLLPFLFYLLVFEPDYEHTQNAMVIIAISFATFENICRLVENGAEKLDFILLRGCSTGSMHVVCGFAISFGINYVLRSHRLKIAGILGLLSFAITFHAMYNLLISAGGIIQTVGYILPVAAVLAGFLLTKKLHL